MDNLNNDGCAGGMRCKTPDAQHGRSMQVDGNAAARPPALPECSSYPWTDPNNMLRLFLSILTLLFACSAFAAPPVVGDAAKGKATAAQVCVACHGADGNGLTPPNPDFPKLAGKQPEYLLKQLKDFKSGKRKNDIMSGMVASLTLDDMANLALHFSAQKNRPGTASNPELLDFGKKFYTDGNPDQGVPACAGCHQPDGGGTSTYPHLAGQYVNYTYQQLKRFASGDRDNDKGLVMQSLAMRMTEQEMKAVSEYIVTQK
jgi:cytochrome c553